MSQRHIYNLVLKCFNRTSHNRNHSSYNTYNLKIANSQFTRLNATASKFKCWKCGIERRNASDLFCEECNSIQNPPDKSNYFKVFNLDITYDVNQKALTNSYRKMQSVLHPDKFTNKSDTEKQISEEYSSLVNRAYKTLYTPINRALHLLALNNESIGEENKSDDPHFLMEMMELNEELDEANTPDKIKELWKKNNKMLDKYSAEISISFKKGDISEAKQAIIKMKYYNSLSKRINDIMREKGIID